MQKTALWLFASLLGLGLAGCTSMTSQDGHDETQARPASSTDTTTAPQKVKYADFEPEVLYELLTAEIAAQRGRYDVTLANYVRAAKQSRDAGVIKRAMRIAQSLNGDNAQRQLADLWLETDPDNLEAHRVAALQAIKRNELQTALDHMEKIMELGGDADFDSLAAMAANLPPEQQSELLNLYRKLETRHPDNQEIHYSIALLLKITGDPKAALTQLKPLLDRQPDFQPALVLKGDLLYETGQKEAAVQFLQTNTRRYPDNRQMGTLYGRILVSEGDLQAAQDEFQRLLERFPDTPGLRLSHALVALENGDTEVAREDLTSLIEQGHHTSEAHYYLGRIADQEGDIESAIGFYENVKEGSHFFPALARLSALRADLGELDQALAHIHQLRGKNPGRADNFWLIEINLLASNDRREQALKAANTAIEAYPDNARLLYARAMLRDSKGNTPGAERDLRAIIDQQPDNAVALNALGYILTNQGGRLAEAEELIRRALAQDKNNPAIMDSMGWVLYRQGRVDEALTYLQAAYDNFPDPEVAAHLGEALWTSGQRDKARRIWRDGLERKPDDTLIHKTMERLGAGLTP